MKIDFNKVPRYIRREIDYPGAQIRKGDRKRAVQQVQEWLNYHQCRTLIDSDFGPATEACVRQFQGNSGLPQSGRVNRETWNALVGPMKTALLAPDDIESMTDPQAVRAAANQHLAQHPVEIGGQNRGPWVRLYCAGNDGKEWAWCAGFVSMIMHQAYFYRGRKPPIEGSVSCDVLAAQAKQAAMFIPGKSVQRNQFNWRQFDECCIFLRRRVTSDWTHTGFGLDRDRQVFMTIEGNTNDEGEREGYEACSRTRSIDGDYDFIRIGGA